MFIKRKSLRAPIAELRHVMEQVDSVVEPVMGSALRVSGALAVPRNVVQLVRFPLRLYLRLSLRKGGLR